MIPAGVGYTCQDEAKAEPFWTSHRIKPSRTLRGNSWRDHLDLDMIQNMIDHSTGKLWTYEDMIAFFRQNLRTDGEFVLTRHGVNLLTGQAEYDRVPFGTLIKDWYSFVDDALEPLEYILSGHVMRDKRYSKVAWSLMRRMGWAPGKGIGKHEDGRTSPIPTPPPPASSGGGAKPRRRGSGGGQPGQGGARQGPDLKVHETPEGLVYGEVGNRNGAVRCWRYGTPPQQVSPSVQVRWYG